MKNMSVLIGFYLIGFIAFSDAACPTSATGNWGTWSNWNGACASCPDACGTTRLRLCIPNPIAAGCIVDGLTCTGEAIDTIACAGPTCATTTAPTTTTTAPSTTTTAPSTTTTAPSTTTTAPSTTTTAPSTTTTAPTTSTTAPTTTTTSPICGEWSEWGCTCCGGCTVSKCTRVCQATGAPGCTRATCDGLASRDEPTTTCTTPSESCKMPLSVCCSGQAAYLNTTAKVKWCKTAAGK